MKEDNGNGQKIDNGKMDIRKKLTDEVINLVEAKRDTSIYDYPDKDKCLNEIIALLENYRGKEAGGIDITAELIKLYQNDPMSNKVIQYLLAKYKIIPLNAVESIRLHREEILLNIVNVYKKMWDMRGKIMLQAIQSGGKPVKIIIEERGKDEGIQEKKQATTGEKHGDHEGTFDKKKKGRDIHKKDSDGI